MDSIIESVRKSDNDRLVTIVVDSVAAATTKVELQPIMTNATLLKKQSLFLKR